MSQGSSLQGALSSATREALGPQFGKLASATESLTRGFSGLVPATNQAVDAFKGFAAAAGPTGLRPLTQSFDLLASTVGVVLVPGVVLLAAGVAAAADSLMEDLEPALDKVAQWYADHIGDFEKFSDAVKSATEWAIRLAMTGKLESDEHARGRGKDSPAEVNDLWGPASLWARWDEKRFADRKGAGLDERIAQANADRAAGFPNGRPPQLAGPAGNGFPGDPAAAQRDLDNQWNKADQPDEKFMAAQGKKNRIREFIDIFKQDMQAAMGGAGGFGRIEDAWRKNQQAAMQSAMQAKFLERFDKAIRLLDKVNDKLDQQARQQRGA